MTDRIMQLWNELATETMYQNGNNEMIIALKPEVFFRYAVYFSRHTYDFARQSPSYDGNVLKYATPGGYIYFMKEPG